MKKVFWVLFFAAIIYHARAQVNPAVILVDTLQSRFKELQENISKNLSPVPNQKTDVAIRDSLAPFDSLNGKITVLVKNLRNTSGNINIALYESYKSFINKSVPYKGASVAVTDLSMKIEFDSVMPGVYSIAAFHDEDRNGVLKTNQLNIPVEGYCFSNNIIANMGPPDYNQIKFIYNGKNKTLILFMTYLKFPR